MIIADRIIERMEQLGVKPSPLATSLGLSPGFFSDLKHGKKKSISAELLPKLAAVLSCDGEYLLGMQAEPRRNGAASGNLTLSGAINRRAWIDPAEDPWAGRPVAAHTDARFPADMQRAFMNLGESVTHDGTAIPDGALLIVVSSDWQPRPGDVMVAEERRDGLVRRFVGVVGASGASLMCANGNEFLIADLHVVGIVSRVVQVL